MLHYLYCAGGQMITFQLEISEADDENTRDYSCSRMLATNSFHLSITLAFSASVPLLSSKEERRS